MTDEQLATAKTHRGWHQERFGYEKSNVRFLKGYIEKLDELDLAHESFDIIVSNCVINLSVDKPAVFRGAFRPLEARWRAPSLPETRRRRAAEVSAEAGSASKARPSASTSALIFMASPCFLTTHERAIAPRKSGQFAATKGNLRGEVKATSRCR